MTTEANIAQMTPEQARAEIQSNLKSGIAFSAWFLSMFFGFALSYPIVDVICYVILMPGALLLSLFGYRKGWMFTRVLLTGTVAAAAIAYQLMHQHDGNVEGNITYIVFAVNTLAVRYLLACHTKNEAYRFALEKRAEDAA